MATRTIKRTRHAGQAWAIETGRSPRRFFGKFFFRDARLGAAIPLHTSGCRVALFETRAHVRAGLKWAKRETLSFPNARAVRVAVTVTTIGRG